MHLNIKKQNMVHIYGYITLVPNRKTKIQQYCLFIYLYLHFKYSLYLFDIYTFIW